ncbi:homologous-pairing protein 2 homolog isoform X2 [Varroa jacobsoni]|uniref:Homologous-pairing protein 2 winged helix domain-containing protein n=1 Tax=Varroa destructor TaxID=109461 RepID=A0A7M7KCW1_VARDE|nr:homologous-pairing protein 2 homolog isoform X2 [Varroa destructor]XP_022706636.1 homologous-pairing protein 2 homolog isoform X2 [Varroa jacobsoni]
MASTEDIVLTYLLDQNRPYSMNDILQNLRQAVGKAALLRDLNALVESDLIIEKTYGKQKIYYANQEKLADATPEQLAEMEIQCINQESLYKEKQQETLELQARIKVLQKQFSTKECLDRTEALLRENEQLQRKIQKLQINGAENNNQQHRLQLEESRRRGVMELQRRRKIAENIINRVLDSGYPETMKELTEELGLEIDSPAKFS